MTLAAALVFAGREADDFRFVILGDRTGEAQPGVFEAALRESMAADPEFVITVGDAIQGGDEVHINPEWQSVLSAVNERVARVRYSSLPAITTSGQRVPLELSSATQSGRSITASIMGLRTSQC